MDNDFIEKEWQDYQEKVMRGDFPEIYRKISRLVFFGGALSGAQMIAMNLGESENALNSVINQVTECNKDFTDAREENEVHH